MLPYFLSRLSAARLLNGLLREAEFGFPDLMDPPAPAPALAAPPKLLTAQQASEILGVSERTLWSMTDRGELPAVRIGRSVRYDPRDVNAWIEKNKMVGSKCSDPA